MKFEQIIRVVVFDCIHWNLSDVRIFDHWQSHLSVKMDFERKLFLNLYLFHDVNALAHEAIISCVEHDVVIGLWGSYKSLSTHHLSYFHDLFWRINYVDASFKAIFNEITSLSIVTLYLSFYYKFGLVILFSSYILSMKHGLSPWKSYIPQRNRNSVVLQQGHRLVFMESKGINCKLSS